MINVFGVVQSKHQTYKHIDHLVHNKPDHLGHIFVQSNFTGHICIFSDWSYICTHFAPDL